MKTVVLAVAAFAFAAAAARASDLPAEIAPSPPFPHVVREAPTVEDVAPGVTYGEYTLATSAGPLVVRVVAVQTHRSDVRVGEVLAHDTLESRGETIGSMAHRTGAVAGINGDYFDIGATNRPTNIVVHNGVLLQMPRNRYALAITRDGSAHVVEFAFMGQVQIGDRTASLDAIDRRPSDAGTSLLTPEYGSVPPLENVTLAALQVLDGTPPLARYRVTRIADNLAAQPAGYYLAIGPGALSESGVPNPGDVVIAQGDLSPLGLGNVATAIGGGPLILHDGSWIDDPDGPNGGEYDKRIPSSGAAFAPDGRLFLIEVDGRQPSVSVGLTRREFSALMRALGATEGLAFDGGGSSTLAVRRPGDVDTEIVNRPSDRIERPVANGVFVYSTDPVGPPVRLVAQPGVVRAVSGAAVPFRVAAVDAASHAASSGAVSERVEPPALGAVRGGVFYAARAGNGRIALHGGALKGTIAVQVFAAPSRLSIEPPDANVDNRGTLQLAAHAADDRGYPLALPRTLAWSTTSGSIRRDGTFHAGTHDARVTVRVGRTSVQALVTVGSHDVALPFAERARYATIPRGGGGHLTRDPQCSTCVALAYAFAGNERAAYAMADLPLPPRTIGLEFDVLDDGSASRLRVALRNAINESVLLDGTLLDTPGWRHVAIRFPAGTQAARLLALYVLPPRGMELARGQIALKNVRAIVAGN